MAGLKLVDASPEGTADFEFLIDERYMNINDVMHGGAAGVIFDMCTTTALGPLSRPGFWEFLGGVTRTLNISYLRAIPLGWSLLSSPFPPKPPLLPSFPSHLSHSVSTKLGTTVRLHSVVTQAGRTMAMIRGTMSSLDGKTIYCTCEHHKVHIPTPAEHLKHRVAWDELWEKDGKRVEGENERKDKNGEQKAKL
ncbi:Uncharacterized protein BP5553_02563 [Venustampulla echinocandica]|uniref:Thioesterase domain-containing protein n=1 Tax=Venustampulla echinocandica TaxID=2656787 RepID=A0A370TRU0_9HELO|nr:Uncharacterized protein BP5553_02563 [Venustampulla echinocandica]RDL38223.1 Uncharacterized protein BP5553_02563 [Venustampulla echinocandica]